MPIAGTREPQTMGTSYRKDPLYQYAKAFAETANMILKEDSFDIFDEPTRLYRHKSPRAKMKKFFVENMVDMNDPTKDAIDLEDEKLMAETQFENDVNALYEHVAPMEYSPMVGMALPIHKLILMNNVFDKGGIQKVTAMQPAFTITLERRILVKPDGTELDMFLQQNMIADAIDSTNPVKIIEMDLPVTEDKDVVADEFGGTVMDSLDISTYICALQVENVQIDIGDPMPDEDGYILRGAEVATEQSTKTVWFPVDIRFTPNYGGPGHYDRAVTQPIQITYKDATQGGAVTTIKAIISGSMNKNRFNIVDMNGKIKKIRMAAKLDSSNAMLETVSTKWKRDTDYVEIGTSTPINTTISPEEVKDVAAMYNVNQLTMHLSMFKTVLSEYKDKKIKDNLDESYRMLDERTGFFGKFDFVPRFQYALDPVEYRQKTWMDFLDSFATRMLQVLNDPNMTFTIFGDPDIVRKITPKEYTYAAPASIGPVTLDYTQTICNVSDKRVYNFIGSDKMRNSKELILLINPRNSERIIYRIYDYQLYVSNEIRNISNPALPAIHAFERWKFLAYQPVQGRVQILNDDKLYAD